MDTIGEAIAPAATYTVTVYITGPGCMQCRMTKRDMDKKGITYREVNIRENKAAAEYVSALDADQAPVCVVEDGTNENYWSGFRPDRIAQLAES